MNRQDMMECLFHLYEKKMYAVACAILRNKGQAEDAVQEAFIRSIGYLEYINDPEDQKTAYLMLRLIRSAAIDIYRKNRRNRELRSGTEILCRRNGETDYETAENRQWIRSVLADMTPKEREIVQLHSYMGFSFVEVGKLLGISESAAAKRFVRAKQHFIRKGGLHND